MAHQNPQSNAFDTSYEQVLVAAYNRGCRIRRSGDSAALSCPTTNHARGDRRPSLSVLYDGEKVLLYCHAGCETLDILVELGLTYADLFDDGADRDQWGNPRPGALRVRRRPAEKSASTAPASQAEKMADKAMDAIRRVGTDHLLHRITEQALIPEDRAQAIEEARRPRPGDHPGGGTPPTGEYAPPPAGSKPSPWFKGETR